MFSNKCMKNLFLNFKQIITKNKFFSILKTNQNPFIKKNITKLDTNTTYSYINKIYFLNQKKNILKSINNNQSKIPNRILIANFSTKENIKINTESITKEKLEELKHKKLSNKLNTIFENEHKERQNNRSEKEFILEKLERFHITIKLLRFPLFIFIFPFAWMNPFSSLYSFSLIFTNNYMLFLTIFESSIFFSAGLTHYYINTSNYDLMKTFMTYRDSRNFRRMSVSFMFFSMALISAFLSNSFLNNYSLGLILLMNIFLYVKYSHHIILKLFDRDIFLERMTIVFNNCLLIVSLLLIISWKQYIYSSLI